MTINKCMGHLKTKEDNGNEYILLSDILCHILYIEKELRNFVRLLILFGRRLYYVVTA
jgi:hypothetical protein